MTEDIKDLLNDVERFGKDKLDSKLKWMDRGVKVGFVLTCILTIFLVVRMENIHQEAQSVIENQWNIQSEIQEIQDTQATIRQHQSIIQSNQAMILKEIDR